MSYCYLLINRTSILKLKKYACGLNPFRAGDESFACYLVESGEEGISKY